MEIYKLLAEVMGEVSYVQKDKKNDFHGYSYASAEAVLRKVSEALAKRGICVSSESELLQNDPGRATVRVTLTFLHESGSVSAQGIGSALDKGDKACMKANTAAVKYAVSSAFLISWGDDPENDSKTDEIADLYSECLLMITDARSISDLEAATKQLKSASKKLGPNFVGELRRKYEERAAQLKS